MNHIHILFDVISYGIGFLTVILAGLIYRRNGDLVLKDYFFFVSGTFFINLSYINDTLGILAKTPVSAPEYQTLPLYLVRIFFYLGSGLMAYFGPLWLYRAAGVWLAKRAKIGLFLAIVLFSMQELVSYFRNQGVAAGFILILYEHYMNLFFVFLALGLVTIIIVDYRRFSNRWKGYIKSFMAICLLFIPLELIATYFGPRWGIQRLIPRYFITTSFFYLFWSLVNVQFLIKKFLIESNLSGPIHKEISTSALESYQLSAREKEIVMLMAQGYSNQEIAAALHITVATVKTHFHRIFAKTGAKSRMELLCKMM